MLCVPGEHPLLCPWDVWGLLGTFSGTAGVCLAWASSKVQTAMGQLLSANCKGPIDSC